MRLTKISVLSVIVWIAAFAITGCNKIDEPDNREPDYGYVQFKLYKEASYEDVTRAVSQLDFLRDAYKLQVNLLYGETTITQIVSLSAADNQLAEFGLRSDKLKLLAGRYQIATFTLYDRMDNVLYNGVPIPSKNIIEIKVGGLEVHDLLANVQPRGQVKFSLIKDFVNDTRADKPQYPFSEIKYVTIKVQNTTGDRAITTFDLLPAKFSTHIDFDKTTDPKLPWNSSASVCDTLLSMKAGIYKVIEYSTYSSNKNISKTRLEFNNAPKIDGKDITFEVTDNSTTNAQVGVTMYHSAEYIKDYVALRDIWEALDGENWYYDGDVYMKGCNWDFNRDIDLWGAQPGVRVHTNGRVASLSLSGFGFKGHMPAALGQLTALVELYLGTHNDNNEDYLPNDPTAEPGFIIDGGGASRLETHKSYLKNKYIPTQLSEPLARAFAEMKSENPLGYSDPSDPVASFYEKYRTQDHPMVQMYNKYEPNEIIDPVSGKHKEMRRLSNNHLRLRNGLESLPPEIGNLTNLQLLYIANSKIETLPDEIVNLTALTDLEIYNCPNMTDFPDKIAELPALISIILADNQHWSHEQLMAGLDKLAKGEAKEKIQLLYLSNNNLEETPESFSNLKSLGLLDLNNNKLKKIHPLGPNVFPYVVFLDNNNLTEITVSDGETFMGIANMETFSARNNKIEEFPNIFSSTGYTILTVDFAYNNISSFPADFKGIKAESVSLAGNNFHKIPGDENTGKYPTAFAETNSFVMVLNLSGCGIEEIPDEAWNTGENTYAYTTIDLTYNKLTKVTDEYIGRYMPYLYGVDVSFNRIDKFPFMVLNTSYLTVLAVRGQRDEDGKRCLKEWPKGIFQHKGLRALYLGSNNLQKVDDTISFIIYYLDISDNPEIIFDASGICANYRAGTYFLIYDDTQDIRGCQYM